MLPLRDNIPARSIPLVTWALIAANALVFLFELMLPRMELRTLIMTYGMVPARLSLEHPLSLQTLVSNMFLHSGWIHFLSNMWVLFIFGDNVEDRMGGRRYLLFYLLSGIAANLLQAFLSPGSQLPSIGASGAIAGVLGAYFLLYPGAKVVTLIPVLIFPCFIEIPAFIYLGFWFLSQIYSGVFSLGMASGVAWWAHIGGFVFGVITVRLFARRPPPQAAYYSPGSYRL